MPESDVVSIWEEDNVTETQEELDAELFEGPSIYGHGRAVFGLYCR